MSAVDGDINRRNRERSMQASGLRTLPFFRERGYHHLSLDQHPHPELLNASIIGPPFPNATAQH